MSTPSRRSSYSQVTSHPPSHNRKVSATPSNPGQTDHARQGSDPTIITVVRNGKVYHSKKTPAGELNSRGRRKQRRAEEREASVREGAGQREDADTDDGWIGESPTVDVYDEPTVAPTVGSDLSSWKFPTSSPSSPTYRSKAPPPLNPFVMEDSPAGPHPRDMLAPPFTPSPSGSDDGRASSPHSYHSRSSSLNANAPVFSPTRYCPLTPRSPCSSNGGHSRHGSISGSPGAQVSEGSSEFPLYSRRHSLALAAWEAAQRRMSTQHSDTKSAEQAMYSPTAPLSAQSWAPGATYGDTQGWMNVESPTHSRASSENLGRARSGSLAAGAAYNGSIPESTPRKASTSSSAGVQSAAFNSFSASDFYAARRGSLPPAIANVHAQYGLDPAVDQLADLGHLIHAEGSYQTSLDSPPILEDLSSRDIMRMESAIVQPRPVRRSTRLTEGWIAEQNGRSKRRSPLKSSSELED